MKRYTNLASAMLNENTEEIAGNLTNIFNLTLSEIGSKEEKFCHALFEAIFIATGIKVEARNGESHGWADLVLELYRLLYIVDIKFNESPEEALKQIDACRYYESFFHLGKTICLLGLSFLKDEDPRYEKEFEIKCVLKKVKHF